MSLCETLSTLGQRYKRKFKVKMRMVKVDQLLEEFEDVELDELDGYTSLVIS